MKTLFEDSKNIEKVQKELIEKLKCLIFKKDEKVFSLNDLKESINKGGMFEFFGYSIFSDKKNIDIISGLFFSGYNDYFEVLYNNSSKNLKGKIRKGMEKFLYPSSYLSYNNGVLLSDFDGDFSQRVNSCLNFNKERIIFNEENWEDKIKYLYEKNIINDKFLKDNALNSIFKKSVIGKSCFNLILKEFIQLKSDEKIFFKNVSKIQDEKEFNKMDLTEALKTIFVLFLKTNQVYNIKQPLSNSIFFPRQGRVIELIQKEIAFFCFKKLNEKLKNCTKSELQEFKNYFISILSSSDFEKLYRNNNDRLNDDIKKGNFFIQLAEKIVEEKFEIKNDFKNNLEKSFYQFDLRLMDESLLLFTNLSLVLFFSEVDGNDKNFLKLLENSKFIKKIEELIKINFSTDFFEKDNVLMNSLKNSLKFAMSFDAIDYWVPLFKFLEDENKESYEEFKKELRKDIEKIWIEKRICHLVNNYINFNEKICSNQTDNNNLNLFSSKNIGVSLSFKALVEYYPKFNLYENNKELFFKELFSDVFFDKNQSSYGYIGNLPGSYFKIFSGFINEGDYDQFVLKMPCLEKKLNYNFNYVPPKYLLYFDSFNMFVENKALRETISVNKISEENKKMRF